MKYKNEIEAAAKEHGLDSNLVAAIVATESNFDTGALRYEDHWKYYFEPRDFARRWNISLATEQALQRFSFGLMQIMLGTAREHGYEVQAFKLCEPEIGLYWGSKYFAVLLKRHGDRDKAISSYNQGSPRRRRDGKFGNQEYVDKVIANYEGFLNADRDTKISTT